MVHYPSWGIQHHCWYSGIALAKHAVRLVTLGIMGSIPYGNPTFAQIAPDATLGAESSVVTPNIEVRGLPAELIEGGAVRGVNLFHSFNQFNAGDGQRVYFANPVGIEHILTRITGNNSSTILGTLGVDGGANLFLLNPNGIIFGENAQLDIAGSFVATTANSLVFENGFEFSATTPEAPPLLSIHVTPGLQYGSNHPGATISSAGHLAAGQDLTLSAGNLNLQGQLHAGRDLTLQANDTVTVRDSTVNPFIASAQGKLLVQGDRIVDIFALNHPNSGFFSGGDMVLRSANSVGGDAHYSSGGSFRIEQLDGSLGNLFSPYDPVIRSLGDVSFNNYEGTSLHILAAGRVYIPGLVRITGPETGSVGNDYLAEEIRLSDGTVVPINGSIQSTLDVRAGVSPALVGSLGVTGQNFSDSFYRDSLFFRIPENPTLFPTPTNADITINEIAISAPNGLVFLTNQYQPNTALSGNIQISRVRTGNEGLNSSPIFFGDSGSIIVDSRGDITIANSNSGRGTVRTDSITNKAGDITLIADGSFIMANGVQLAALALGQGDAGNINILVRDSVLMTGNAQMAAFTRGQGDAGNINIVALNAVSFASDSFISTEVKSGAVGNGGNININAGSLSIDGNSTVQANTEGQGNAGIITIDANRLELTRGGKVLTTSGGTGNAGDIAIEATDSVNISLGFIITGSTGAGDSGNLSISTRELKVSDGGQISTISSAQGDAGDISIEATDTVNVSNLGFVITGTGESSTGNSGNLFIGTGQLNVSDGGQITTASAGIGNAGDLSITAIDSVNVSSQGLVTTSSTGAGDSGNLSISTAQLNVSDRAVIGAISFSTGNAGNLAIAATDSVNVSNEGLLTTGTEPTSTGNGGTLSIDTRQLEVTDKGQISTAAIGRGNSGDLLITAADSMNLVNQSVVTTSSDKGAGVAGRLEIQTNNLSIRDRSLIVSSTIGTGDAGDLIVRANDSIEVVGSGSKLSTDTFGSGNGGDLTVDTGTLSIRDGGAVSTVVAPNSSGNAGTLTVRATDSIEVVNASKLASETYGSGNGGNLTIATENLSVRNEGEVSTGALDGSSGQGGNLSVAAFDSVELNGGSLATATLGTGRAGDLNVTTRRLTTQGGGRVEAGTYGFAQGGTVNVNAADSIELSGTSPSGKIPTAISAFSSGYGNGASGDVNLATGELIVRDSAEITTETLGSGEGGDIEVNANSLSLTNSGSILSRSQGLGRAGDISLNLSDTLQANRGEISASSAQTGGGNIDITANTALLRNGSLISTSVFDSTGGGGNITIRSDIFLALEDSDILANADAGPGGNITINSPVFLAALFSGGQAVAVGRNPGNLTRFRGNGQVDISDDFAELRGNAQVDISADSATGTPGSVSYPDVDPARGTTALPSDLVDATELIDRTCSPGGAAQTSSFVVTGRGGIPPSPLDPLDTDAIVSEWISLDLDTEDNVSPATTTPESSVPKQIVEAQGWIVNEKGQIVLIAQAPTVMPQGEWHPGAECNTFQSTYAP